MAKENVKGSGEKRKLPVEAHPGTRAKFSIHAKGDGALNHRKGHRLVSPSTTSLIRRKRKSSTKEEVF